MKSKFTITVLVLFMVLSLMGQETVQTPWGTTVTVYEVDEQNSYYRSQSDINHASYENNGAILQETWSDPPTYPFLSTTSTFNCHGYAWHMYWFNPNDDLADPYNMSYTEAEKYFSDPSFVECTKSEADVIYYNTGSHSALTTGTEDILLSKWNTGPLAIHGIDTGESPYPITAQTSVTYYKKCSSEFTGAFITDDTMNVCAVKLVNSGLSNYIDIEIEYEEAVLIEGSFSTETGATLYIHPD